MENMNEVEILLVEDNPNDAELAIRALKKNNLLNPLHWVKDGVEALDFLFAEGVYKARNQSNLPKVILLDLKLPKINGLEVLEKVKSDERTKTTPVVVLTSSREERDLLKAYQNHVNSYIVKPVDFNKFLASIKEIGNYWLLLNENQKTQVHGNTAI